jgi:hypothetical protein
MEHRGVTGHEAPRLAPGAVERPPGLTESPGETAPGSPGSAQAAGTPGVSGVAAPAVRAGAVGGRPATGDARVDEAVARLADLAELPVAEHPPVFEYVHERLTEALGDLDVHDPAGPGSRAPGPGS